MPSDWRCFNCLEQQWERGSKSTGFRSESSQGSAWQHALLACSSDRWYVTKLTTFTDIYETELQVAWPYFCFKRLNNIFSLSSLASRQDRSSGTLCCSTTWRRRTLQAAAQRAPPCWLPSLVSCRTASLHWRRCCRLGATSHACMQKIIGPQWSDLTDISCVSFFVLLCSRYGLYSSPFDPVLFDLEVSGSSCKNAFNSSIGVQSDEIDLSDILSGTCRLCVSFWWQGHKNPPPKQVSVIQSTSHCVSVLNDKDIFDRLSFSFLVLSSLNRQSKLERWDFFSSRSDSKKEKVPRQLPPGGGSCELRSVKMTDGLQFG